VHVVYGVEGLKTHSKIVMVVREKQTGSAAMSTLVPATITKTARLYTDLGLFATEELGADLTDLIT